MNASGSSPNTVVVVVGAMLVGGFGRCCWLRQLLLVDPIHLSKPVCSPMQPHATPCSRMQAPTFLQPLVLRLLRDGAVQDGGPVDQLLRLAVRAHQLEQQPAEGVAFEVAGVLDAAPVKLQAGGGLLERVLEASGDLL